MSRSGCNQIISSVVCFQSGFGCDCPPNSHFDQTEVCKDLGLIQRSGLFSVINGAHVLLLLMQRL